MQGVTELMQYLKIGYEQLLLWDQCQNRERKSAVQYILLIYAHLNIWRKF